VSFIFTACLMFLVLCLFDFFFKRKNKGKFFTHGVFLELILPGFVCGILLAIFMGRIADKEDRVVSSTPIMSMKNVTSERGSYFLAIGNSWTAPYYEYYKKTDSGYQLDRINADTEGITITESNTTSPTLKVYESFVTKEYQNWSFYLGDKKYQFTVPEGTLQKEFTLN